MCRGPLQLGDQQILGPVYTNDICEHQAEDVYPLDLKVAAQIS